MFLAAATTKIDLKRLFYSLMIYKIISIGFNYSETYPIQNIQICKRKSIHIESYSQTHSWIHYINEKMR